LFLAFWAFGQCSKKVPLVPSKVSIFGILLVWKNSGILAFCQCGQKLAFWHLALWSYVMILEFFSGVKSRHYVCVVKSWHFGILSEWSKFSILALCQYGESDRTKGEFEQDVDETQFIHFN
jgi:hypothetical protein